MSFLYLFVSKEFKWTYTDYGIYNTYRFLVNIAGKSHRILCWSCIKMKIVANSLQVWSWPLVWLATTLVSLILQLESWGVPVKWAAAFLWLLVSIMERRCFMWVSKNLFFSQLAWQTRMWKKDYFQPQLWICSMVLWLLWTNHFLQRMFHIQNLVKKIWPIMRPNGG